MLNIYDFAIMYFRNSQSMFNFALFYCDILRSPTKTRKNTTFKKGHLPLPVKHPPKIIKGFLHKLGSTQLPLQVKHLFALAQHHPQQPVLKDQPGQ